ncbi:hypothetical protein PhaeoP83_04504 (plasmid) [Phaeobacter inhibens]|jgi:hypothetical protein|uniref:hypothetical protein n=1 Tax=Phaeobacter inhibens TaxID=221822 RepID=UPI000C9CD3AA|nr:hypothetical protein [Phaeobacter inhibens]AUQ52722.1 hypothetical protein PhaeoP83_04504 [Phaeobacter inhibens]AUR22585.1 hypothetical protein PhaeoP80_04562 [Phaeobacter inhibens]
MITLTGECRGIVITPARTGKDGQTYPERGQLQIETVEQTDHGDKIKLWDLYGDPQEVQRFSAMKGREITVPVRPYVSGRVVAFALAEDARPLAISDASARTDAA